MSGVRITLRLLSLVILYSGTLMYDITLVLALLFTQIHVNFVTPFYYPFLGCGQGLSQA